MEWTAELRAELMARWARKEKPGQIRKEMGLTQGQLAGRITAWNLHSPPTRRRARANIGAGVIDGRTRYPQMVTDDGVVLKDGRFQQKLGGRVLKGPWRGMPIYAVTLEERATCPRDCKLWALCYGNNMRWAKRMRHGPALEQKIWKELAVLNRRRPRGFVVRLHILGDFASVGIVEMWREALDAFPALRIFGYTAWQRDTRIGAAVAALRDAQWDRFAVRTSGAASGPRTFVIEDESQRGEAVVCPAQLEKFAAKRINCGTCGLCFNSKVPVAFLRH